MLRLLLVMTLSLPVALTAETLRSDSTLLVQRAGEQLVERLRAAHSGYARIEAVPLATAPRPPIQDGDVVVRLPSDTRLRSRICVWLDVTRNKRVVMSVPVWFDVRAYKKVPVVARALRPKEAVQETDVIVQERDVAGLRNPVMEGMAIATHRARRYLPVGTILSATDLEPLPTVLPAQQVAVRIVTGSVVIETTGIAEQEGSPGETIRIRNATGDGSYYAQVASENRVEVVTP